MSEKNNNKESEVELLKKKLSLLIKGLKEEKQITTKLKEENDLLKSELEDKKILIKKINEENEILKYDLEEKKVLVKKMKEEYQELMQEKIPPEKLSSFFTSLEKEQNIETPDEEKFKLKKENEEFCQKIKILEKDKNYYMKQLEIIEKQKDSEINSLKSQLNLYKDSIIESEEKSSKLINNIKQEQLISNDKESKIAKLQKEIDNLNINNTSLKQQNAYYMNIIEQLKCNMENKGKEFYYLEKEIDDNKEINIKEYIFKGYINKISKWLVSDWNKFKKNMTIFFGKKNFLVTFEMNGCNFDVDIEDILKIEYYCENQKKIKFVIEGKGKKFIMQALNIMSKKTNEQYYDAIFVSSFTERECKYIIKFYTTIKNNFKKEKEEQINSTFDWGF